jgi:Raf kinase inhibitor-like YbhB/YbcL family protein
MALLMTSEAFEDCGVVPMKYSCFGDNMQPGFKLANPPDGVVTYALIFHDIDVALDGSTEDGSHWVVWNLPAGAGGWPEGGLPDGAVVGRNVEDKNAYLGPGAPAGPRYHHYVFELYALDRALELPATAGRDQLLLAMEGATLAKASYIGRFRRPS